MIPRVSLYQSQGPRARSRETRRTLVVKEKDDEGAKRGDELLRKEKGHFHQRRDSTINRERGIVGEGGRAVARAFEKKIGF